jgi:hypothetical protein
MTDGIEHEFHILKNKTIFKPDHANAEAIKVGCALLVVLKRQRVFVDCAIKFDNDATFRTIKVGNKRTYSMLSSELLSVQFRAFQISPQQSLCWS